MVHARLSQGRWWRGALLVALCALAYYICFDQGRDSLRPRLADQERRFQEEREQLTLELRRLEAQLARCLSPPAETDRTTSLRIALRVNHSKTLFDGLVLSVLDLDSEAGRVRVQLNFVRESRQVTEDLAAGGSLGFSLGGRDWALVVAGLTLTTANFNILEIKNAP